MNDTLKAILAVLGLLGAAVILVLATGDASPVIEDLPPIVGPLPG
jgi:hypothetical protein